MRFTAARTSVYGTFALGVAVAAAVETPVVHLLAHRAPWWLRVGLLVANIAGIVWLFRERHRMRDAGYTLDADALAIAIPGKWHGAIPVALIASARRISPVPGKSRPRGTIRITPIDLPNVELQLRAPATLTGSLGIERSAARIQIFVDEPDAFIDAIRARIPPAP